MPQIYWRTDGNGILRPQGDAAPDAFVPVRIGDEANPMAIVKMPGIEARADIATAPAYQSLQEPIRNWLQRLGIIG
ncbi:MAG: hypothetical protein LBD40_03400, partial [Puniceicoccales bacterium]|nr:hypothetical protein [Puniceicoccales bacterium]